MLKAIRVVQGIDVGALHPVSHEHDKIHEQKVALELFEIAWLYCLCGQKHTKSNTNVSYIARGRRRVGAN